MAAAGRAHEPSTEADREEEALAAPPSAPDGRCGPGARSKRPRRHSIGSSGLKSRRASRGCRRLLRRRSRWWSGLTSDSGRPRGSAIRRGPLSAPGGHERRAGGLRGTQPRRCARRWRNCRRSPCRPERDSIAPSPGSSRCGSSPDRFGYSERPHTDDTTAVRRPNAEASLSDSWRELKAIPTRERSRPRAQG